MARAETEKKKTRRSVEKKADAQGNPLMRYFRETRGELRKVTWPSQDESLRLTAIVIGVTLFMALFLAGFDWLFSNGFQGLLRALVL